MAKTGPSVTYNEGALCLVCGFCYGLGLGQLLVHPFHSSHILFYVLEFLENHALNNTWKTVTICDEYTASQADVLGLNQIASKRIQKACFAVAMPGLKFFKDLVY